MKLLLHVCCGPCTTYPLERLRSGGHDVQGYFYNPNIHPYREFKRRLSSLEDFANKKKLPLFIEGEYGLCDYLRRIVFHEKERCLLCYKMRLQKTAQKAVESGADAFSSTLLYSRYQRHETIIKIGEEMSRRYDVQFYYEDFRNGWQEGIERAISMDLYRQAYCGCIYSEQERYDKRLKKKLRQERQHQKTRGTL